MELHQKNNHEDPLIQDEFERVYGILPKPWQNFDANPTAEATMTWGTFTQKRTRWYRHGDTAHVDVYILGTTGTAGKARLYIEVPYTPKYGATDNFMGGACLVRDGAGVYVTGFWTWVASTQKVVVLRNDSANFGLGTERGFMLQFEYEITG